VASVRSGSDGVAGGVLDAGAYAGDCVLLLIASCLFAVEAPGRERLVDTHTIALERVASFQERTPCSPWLSWRSRTKAESGAVRKICGRLGER
jgi:hypothetical protein